MKGKKQIAFVLKSADTDNKQNHNTNRLVAFCKSCHIRETFGLSIFTK